MQRTGQPGLRLSQPPLLNHLAMHNSGISEAKKQQDPCLHHGYSTGFHKPHVLEAISPEICPISMEVFWTQTFCNSQLPGGSGGRQALWGSRMSNALSNFVHAPPQVFM